MEGTRTATMAGTATYMAPEVPSDRYGRTVDIYSLGLVMYWMLNGYRAPFMPEGMLTAGDAPRAEARHLSGESIPSPEGCPDELSYIVLKACSYHPEDRYQSAKEMASDIDAFLAGRTVAETGEAHAGVRGETVAVHKKETTIRQDAHGAGIPAGYAGAPMPGEPSFSSDSDWNDAQDSTVIRSSTPVTERASVGEGAAPAVHPAGFADGNPGSSEGTKPPIPASGLDDDANWDDAGDVTIGRGLGSCRGNVAWQAEGGERTVGQGRAGKSGWEGPGAEAAHPGGAARPTPRAAENAEAPARPRPSSQAAGNPRDPAAGRKATGKEAAQGSGPKGRGAAVAIAVAALLAAVAIGILAMTTGSSDAGSTTGTSQTSTVSGSSSTSSASGSAGVGSTVALGSYEQDGDTSDGAEPIEWRVLAVEGGRALLISEYALDAKPFNEDYDDGNGWDTSSLKAWLQGEFAQDAGLSEYADGLTLLSADEAERYFSSDDDRMCAPTQYAIDEGAWQLEDDDHKVDGVYACNWWLRSAGSNSNNAANVNANGNVDTDGNNVDNDNIAVRPAQLWEARSLCAGAHSQCPGRRSLVPAGLREERRCGRREAILTSCRTYLSQGDCGGLSRRLGSYRRWSV